MKNFEINIIFYRPRRSSLRPSFDTQKSMDGGATTSDTHQEKHAKLRKYLHHSRTYRINRMLPGKGHHGRKTGNKRRNTIGADDFEINMMLSM